MHLNVVARLSHAAASRLSNALAPGSCVTLVSSFAELRVRRRLSELNGSMFDVAVLDPSVDGREGIPVCLSVLQRLPHLPVVLYVPVSPDAMRAVAAVSCRASHDVILAGHDDQPDRLRRVVEEAGSGAAALRLLNCLEPHLQRLPPKLVEAVKAAFANPASFPSVESLADIAGLTRRSVDRWFHRAGLSSAGCFLSAVRAIEAHHALYAAKLRVAAAAHRLGYPSTRSFVRRTTAATGASPAVLRVMPESALTALLRERLVREQGMSARPRAG